MKRFATSSAAALFVFLTSACTTGGSGGLANGDLLSESPTGADAARAKAGPSLTFEDQRELASNSLLVETERLREELARATEQIGRLETEVKAKNAEAVKLTSETAALARERDELKRAADAGAAKECALTEQAAAAEIERLRMERQLVELKLASMVREGK
jgi:hypothetical protein